MPELQIPPHPTHDYFCGNCKFWLASAAQNLAMVQTQAGVQMVPVAEMVKQGQSLTNVITARMAPCTKFPHWETAAKQHWCHQFESAPKERVVKKNAGKFGEVMNGIGFPYSEEDCPGHVGSSQNRNICERCGAVASDQAPE